jgi:hypothetical protein
MLPDYVIIEERKVSIDLFIDAPEYMHPVVKIYYLGNRYYTLDVDNRLKKHTLCDGDEHESE